jgi:hypothetical protein
MSFPNLAFARSICILQRNKTGCSLLFGGICRDLADLLLIAIIGILKLLIQGS